MNDEWDIFGDEEEEEEADKKEEEEKIPVPHPPPAPTPPTRSPPPWAHLVPRIALAPPGGGPAESRGDGRVVSHESAAAGFPFQHAPVQLAAGLRCQEMEGRGGGRGIRATETVEPGVILMAEYPLVLAGEEDGPLKTAARHPESRALVPVLSLPRGERQRALDDLNYLHPRCLSQLDATEVGALRERHESFLASLSSGSLGEGEDQVEISEEKSLRLLAALRQNAFSSGIYPNHAMLNHSCRPNSLKLSHRGGVQMISETLSTQVIRAGEEVTVHYLERREIARDERRRRLEEQFGFTCGCELCAPKGSAEALLEAAKEEQIQESVLRATNVALVETLSALEGGDGFDSWWLEALAASLGARMEAKLVLHPRHISLARANIFICRSAGELLVLSDEDLAALGDDTVWGLIGEICLQDGRRKESPLQYGFRNTLLATLFVAALELRESQLLYLGPESIHIEAAQPLEHLSQTVQQLQQTATGRRLLEHIWPYREEGEYTNIGAYNLFEASCGRASKNIQYMFS